MNATAGSLDVIRPLRVVVSVGTTVHPFNRLIRAVDCWAEAWEAQQPQPIDLWVQHGHGMAPRHGQGVGMVGRAELVERFSTSDVLVTQAGARTVADANAVGRRPIVVPRRRYLGEHRNDHQFDFVRTVDAGSVWLAPTVVEIGIQLSRAALAPDIITMSPWQPGSTMTALRAGPDLERALATVDPSGNPIKRLLAVIARNGKALPRSAPTGPHVPRDRAQHVRG